VLFQKKRKKTASDVKRKKKKISTSRMQEKEQELSTPQEDCESRVQAKDYVDLQNTGSHSFKVNLYFSLYFAFRYTLFLAKLCSIISFFQ
jgi:hypothetical protein